MTAGLRKRDLIREHLIALIGARAVGQAIPAERRLCVELETSRPTLRAVVDELVREGWLVREHGRGVFVGAPKISQRIVTAPGADRSGYPAAPGTWTSRVLDHSVIPAGTGIGSRLRVEAATPVLRVARQRLVDDQPMALETIHVLGELVPGATADDVEGGSFYSLLRDRYGIEPSAAEQVHEALSADPVQASLLGISPGAAVLSSERVTRDQHGRLFEYTHAVYRGDRYRLVSQLALGGPPDAASPRVTPTV